MPERRQVRAFPCQGLEIFAKGMCKIERIASAISLPESAVFWKFLAKFV